MFVAVVIVPLEIVHAYVVAEELLAGLPVELASTELGAVIVGDVGLAFTVTVVVPADEVQPLTVAVTEYVPDIAVVALAIVGFCRLDVKPFGPVHE
jgi:hypothetical protein